MKIKHMAILILLSKLTLAGDPCPISINFLDIGSSSWIDNKKISKYQIKYPYIGIHTENDATIDYIKKDTPASKIGLKTGDKIVKLNNQKIKNKKGFFKELYSTKYKEGINLEILRDKKRLSFNISPKWKKMDSLIFNLSTYAQSNNCVETKVKKIKDKKEIESKIYFKTKGFDCKNADKMLSKLKRFEFSDGDTIVARGGNRVLLSLINYNKKTNKTICVDSKKYYKTKWNDKKIKKLYNKLYSDYIKDRHLNP